MFVLATALGAEALNIILIALATGLSGLIAWGFAILKTWLDKKIKNEDIKKASNAALSAIEAAVTAVQQTFVSQLKKDGKFDKEAQKEALSKASALALSMLSEETKVILQGLYGSLEVWLTAQIETFVLSLPGHSK